MRRNQQRFAWLGLFIFTALTLTLSAVGQASSGPADGPATADWSNHYLIFSRPGNAEQTSRVEKDPRYWQQFRRRTPSRLSGTSSPVGSELKPDLGRLRANGNRQLRRDWSEDMGSGAAVGATSYPAKFSFSTTTANCASAAQPDFVVYGTGLTGSPTQASIVAFDNLYSGCSGTVPSVYWAYNTNLGQATTSPVFSRDGSQLAFVQTDGFGHGNFVVLKWAPSLTDTVFTPTTLPRLTNVLYFGCIAPCMTSATLRDSGGTPNPDLNSSPYYDYGSDTAYVGDGAGWLHKIAPVFNGIPAEVVSGGWPVQLNPGSPSALTSPVFSSSLGFVFVTDAGGFLYRVGPNSAFVVASGQLDFSLGEGGVGIADSPMVDSTAGVVYVFASSDGSGGCPIGIGGFDCTAVYHLNITFSGGDTGTEAIVGNSTIPGNAPSPLYDGDFDSNYKNSVNATGNLYVCGNTGGNPTLYQVSIQNGALTAVIQGPILASNVTPTPCSLVTDFRNSNVSGGTTEWIFVSAKANGTSSGCSGGGCIFNFKNTPWQPSTAYTVGRQVLDSHFQIQVVTTAGTSGPTAPSWQTLPGKFTTDGTATWVNQGVSSATTPAAWLPSHSYPKGSRILDGNGNIQLATSNGTHTSGVTMPTFNLTPGRTTTDGAGGLVWTNVGAIATAALPAAGGTSGIIIDNTVGSGILPGASQVYFSTLSDQACGTSGTGGCAVQASQPALQ